MNIRLFFVGLLLAGSGCLFGQTPKTLLWKISGKGLQQPSYLFGTMHMNDKRLFQWGDSVFAAIESTSGLAIEVNPDEMAAYMVNNIFNEETSKKLKDVLSAEAYEKYAEALSKKLGIPAKDLTVKDIVREKNKWITEYLRKGEMPTFLDAYLYNIARRQGKWVGGVEDLSDQAGLLEELVDESDIIGLLSEENTTEAIAKGLELMQQLYAAEDLDAIERMSTAFEHRDVILINRNEKMARRMDSLSAIRPMLFAVGVAHLPGDSGVIAFLRKRGFTVDPVMSSKKIDASKHEFKEVELPWVVVYDSISHYKVMMPSTPASVTVSGMIEMKFLMDLPTASAFCTMSFPNPGASGDDEALIEQFSKTITRKKKAGKPKKIERDGLTIIEYLQSDSNGNVRMQLFVKNNIGYMAMMHASNQQAVYSADAERFFNSFIPLSTKKATKTYSFSEHGKDVNFVTPVRMNYSKALSKGEEGTGWEVASYMGTDINSGTYYLFVERKVQKGYYLNNFSEILEEFKTMLPTQMTEMISEGERTFKNGSGYFVKGYGSEEKDVVTNMLYTFRDNRLYLFSAISGSRASYDEFFNSIEFLPYKQGGWAKQANDSQRFSTWAPAPFYVDYSEDSANFQLISFDEASSTTLYISTDTLDNYYWAVSEDAFWEERVKGYNNERDSVVRVVRVKNGDAGGREIWVSRPGGSMSRLRMLRNGKVIHILSAYAQEQHLGSENIDRFFTDFRFSDPVKDYDVTRSRAEELISALADTNTVRDAYYALKLATFTSSDILLLHNALFKSYPLVYEFSDTTDVNYAIAEQLVKLNNQSTYGFIQTQYNNFSAKQNNLKWVALYALANWKTTESNELIGQLVTQPNRPSGDAYDFFLSLCNDLELVKTIYPKMVTAILPDTTYSLYLTELGVLLVDSGVIEKEFLLTHQAKFRELTDLYIKRNKNKTDDEYDWKIGTLIELHERMATPSSIENLRKFLPLKIIYLKKEAALALTRLKQKVDPAIFTAIATDPHFRVDLYDALKELKRLDLFPKAFATQKSLAEGEAMAAASEDGTPESISFVKEKIAEFNGKKYTFYLFKVRFEYDDEVSEYLVVAGGFDPDPKKIEIAQYYTGVYWEKNFDPKAVDTLFNDWKKQYLEDLEDSD